MPNCERCAAELPDDASSRRRFCDDRCRRAAHHAARARLVAALLDEVARLRAGR